MCGRYSLTTPLEGLRELFLFEEQPNLAPRYNIAPTQEVPVVRLGSEDRKRHLTLLRWGLIPSWAKDASIGSRMINARAESVAEKPAFRAAFRQRRCLVPADGFYEWQAKPPRQKSAEKSAKQPYRIIRPDGRPFAFAGLWESWREPDRGTMVESFTIITTDANERLRDIHHRMPVVLVNPADHLAWLDTGADPKDLLDLLRAAPNETLIAVPVSTRVNNVRNDDPEVLEPLTASDNPRSCTPHQTSLF